MDEETIRQRAEHYTWYYPVDFGNGLVVSGNFKVPITNPSNIHLGLGKWYYIIQRNLPDLQGKRVLDIGCNAGIFCIQMARMGCTEVVGVDSNKTWSNWKDQAEFVKEALEWRCKTKYPIRYIDAEMETLPFINLGHFDVVTSLCSIYYLEEPAMHEVLSHLKKNADLILIQCNIRKQDQTPEVHRRATPKFIGDMLKKIGIPYIRFDKPLFYERPVVVGSMLPFIQLEPLGKVDRIRHWIRRKI